MPPGTANLAIYQGDDFGVRVTFTVDGAPYDLTGHTFTAQLRDGTADQDAGDPPLAEFSCVVEDAAAGELRVTLGHEATAELPASQTYRWDLQSVGAGGIVTTFLAGTVAVTAEITRPAGP